MSRFPRYAIYYAPDPDTALARLGAALLGYDACLARDVSHPAHIVEASPDWHDLTRDPRTYGFHATLKAPFSLAGDTTEMQLQDACARFAATPRDVPVIELVVRAISGFLAVVPTDPSRQLVTLAQTIVAEFDPFRAPLTPSDRARRKPETLTARQVAHLDRWGYPYVGDDFRFHMTLTGRLAPDRQAAVLTLLQRDIAALALTTLAIDRIALFKQDSEMARFHIAASYPLASC